MSQPLARLGIEQRKAAKSWKFTLRKNLWLLAYSINSQTYSLVYHCKNWGGAMRSLKKKNNRLTNTRGKKDLNRRSDSSLHWNGPGRVTFCSYYSSTSNISHMKHVKYVKGIRSCLKEVIVSITEEDEQYCFSSSQQLL